MLPMLSELARLSRQGGRFALIRLVVEMAEQVMLQRQTRVDGCTSST